MSDTAVRISLGPFSELSGVAVAVGSGVEVTVGWSVVVEVEGGVNVAVGSKVDVAVCDVVSFCARLMSGRIARPNTQMHAQAQVDNLIRRVNANSHTPELKPAIV